MERVKSTDDDNFPNGGTGVRLGRIVVVLAGVAALSATLVTFVYEFHAFTLLREEFVLICMI